MSGCMREDKPLISIVMAVYHPRMDWLIEQLDSLNAQTYPNLELIACDDGPDEPVDESVFAGHITAFPWELVRNGENLGSNKTFERLTTMARGKYIAYCDQDDVWLSEKISILLELIRRTKAKLVFSDVIVIDREGRWRAGSITRVRRRHVFQRGGGLASSLAFRNFVIGCTMLLETKTAKAAIPFLSQMVHDHWLALFASVQGDIEMASRPLVRYRIHGGNQTNVLAGVSTKSEYIRVRIGGYLARLAECQKRLPECIWLDNAAEWGRARWDYAYGDRASAKVMKQNKSLDPTTTEFELLMLQMPECLFQCALRLLHAGML